MYAGVAETLWTDVGLYLGARQHPRRLAPGRAPRVVFGDGSLSMPVTRFAVLGRRGFSWCA